ncbi:hypothetical protein ACVILI_000481 [Mesorhizobium sp. USDA 4775]
MTRTSRNTIKTELSDTSTPPLSPQGERDLLARLKETPADKLGEAVKASEGFTAEDEDNDKRGVRALNRATLAKIKRCFFWFLFILVCITLAIFAFGFVYLVWIWVASFIDKPDEVGQFLKSGITAVLLILATLFVENVIKNHE